MSSAIKTENVFEDSGISLMARVTGPAGQIVTPSDIASISLVISVKNGTPSGEVAVSPSASVFSTLQTDARWKLDLIGYNFRYDTLSSQIPEGGTSYYFEFKFVPVSGQPFHVVFEVPTLNLLRS